MELIKITEGKAKLILSFEETEKYIYKDGEKRSVLSAARLLSRLASLEEDVFSGCVKVKMKFTSSGGCEITVVKDPLFPKYKIRTFVFTKDGFEKVCRALNKTDFRKCSSAYRKKDDLYILEILTSDSSPLPSRLSDFGRECVLMSRRDFLSAVCTRVAL